MTTQTEAERLADALDVDATNGDMGRKPDQKCHKRKAAAELRRLVSFNQQLMDEVARLQKREWVGLTAEELDGMFSKTIKGKKLVNWVAQTIEAKLKEKNT